ncbi:MAG: hypothetical protein JW847_05590 [Candidatus Omnitrophica bacterium]|nr:hypothetical protein [Candidatus Omnitrophota bacterium]
MIFRGNKTGQTAVEYTVLLILCIGAFIGIQNYAKRGIQGRWKSHIDEMGDQYDPRTADTNLRQTLTSSTNTTIIVMNTQGGYWTRRTDESASTEQKTGYTAVGSY